MVILLRNDATVMELAPGWWITDFDMEKTETPVCWMAQFRDPDGNKLVVHKRKKNESGKQEIRKVLS
jgi:hypothetical protein